MHRKFILILIATLMFLLGACASASTFEVGVEPTNTEAVVETPTIIVTEEPTPLPSVTPEPTVDSRFGAASGEVCFPSEFIPAMTAFFHNTSTGELVELPIAESQDSYSLELPPGEYVAFAYLENDFGFGGSYSNAVPCGLEAGCTDHSLLPFQILPGETTSGIDLCDWYAPESVPANPKAVEPGDPALAGLVYRSLSTSRIWQVGSDGDARVLVNQFEAVISPDGLQALFTQEDDIWLVDLPSGEARNLTNTPDREEFEPQWWPANPDVVIFNSAAFSEERGLSSGHISYITLEDGEYTVLDENLSVSVPALSTDGISIASDAGGSAWLYCYGIGKDSFDAAGLGLNGVMGMVSPSWSPDGTKLTWWVQGDFGNGSQIALAIFDFSMGTYILIHPYQPIGTDAVNPPPVWSADGQWLASTVIGDGTRGALWAFRADGGEEINLGNSAEPVWSPDSGKLAFVRWPENGGPAQEARIMTVEAGVWAIEDTPLLPGSIPLAWLSEK